MEFGTKNILYQFIEGRTHHFGIHKVLNDFGAWYQNRLLFIQIQTLPPSIHQVKRNN